MPGYAYCSLPLPITTLLPVQVTSLMVYLVSFLLNLIENRLMQDLQLVLIGEACGRAVTMLKLLGIALC